MQAVTFNLKDNGNAAFNILEGTEQLGQMEVSITGTHLTVYHTEVAAKAEGKGYAKKLLHAMAAHARTHHLQVIPLCPYVHAQFKRHETEYADIWKKDTA